MVTCLHVRSLRVAMTDRGTRCRALSPILKKKYLRVQSISKKSVLTADCDTINNIYQSLCTQSIVQTLFDGLYVYCTKKLELFGKIDDFISL